MTAKPWPRRLAVATVAAVLFVTGAVAQTVDEFFATLDASIAALPRATPVDGDDRRWSRSPGVRSTAHRSGSDRNTDYRREGREIGRGGSGGDRWRDAVREYQSGAVSQDEVEELARLSEQLRQRIGADKGSPSKEYLDTLRHDLELIRWAGRWNNAAVRRQLLADARADMEVKLIYASWNGTSDDYSVSLSVVTVRRGRPIDGYQVGVVPMRFQGAEPLFLLPRLSSPASGEVPPGRYELVVRDGKRELARQVFRVGVTGRSSESIEVAIP